MFRFTIRDVLWLTVVIALSLAWYTDTQLFRQQYKREHLVRSHLEAALDHEGFRVRNDGDSLTVEKVGGSRYVFGVGR